MEELRQLLARAEALASTTDEPLDHLFVGPEGDRRAFDRLAVIAAVERVSPVDLA